MSARGFVAEGLVPEMEMVPGGLSLTAADRLAALTARATGARCAMIHLAEGRHTRLIGGHNMPPGFDRMSQVPRSTTLAGIVLRTGYPIVVSDTLTDERVPEDAPVLTVGLRSYAGFPVRAPGGEIVGVCAVMDYEPREWQPDELAAVDEGAQACTAFVAEQRAREAEQQQRLFLDTLLDSMDTGVAACDADGNLVVVNRSLRERLGMPATSARPAAANLMSSAFATAPVPAEGWLARLPLTDPGGTPVDPADTPLLRAQEGNHVRGVDQVMHTRQGRRLYRVNAHPIESEGAGHLGAVSVFHDVTAARRAEELQRQLSRSKDDYLNLVGHELRTPVTIIHSYLELLQDSDPRTPLSDLAPMITAAQRGSERLRRLVEALLDLSSLDAGHTEMTMTGIDLTSVAAGVVHAVEERAEAKNIAVTLTAPDRTPIEGDPHRLAQLVAALLDNALLYTPAGGKVEVRVEAAGDSATLEVCDTGVGIPDHERPHVLNRFFRGAITTELSIPGAGLGLAFAALIAERHGGTIQIEPHGIRPGTTVRVTLPR
ncbi:ATP-binding protein [Symbioplanes lichenis]|uniref:ATP-binding protein n=1 Tax=Symbioplanes lichenis TaxID=1629072 RepID=UPI0027390A83|nr:ATP-binding protein [Actinoplanes lichenis]